MSRLKLQVAEPVKKGLVDHFKQDDYGRRTMFNYQKFIEEHSREYGSCPFWSWNDKLENNELRRQIDDMKKNGMTGFFMHARGGLQTQYFSEEWFHAIKTCVDYAKEQGMQAWLYDENGWPSGFANRELLKEPRNLSSYIKMEKSDTYPTDVANDTAVEGVIAVYSMQKEQPVRIFRPDDSREYIVISKHVEGSYVDTLNPEVTKQFLNCVYEEYKKRFPKDLGTAYMPGFFTDEPQYVRYATPWSDILPQKFLEKYGYDVSEVLPALFLDYEGACEKRYDYWSLLHEMFTQNWIRPVYEWCEEHNCKLTGHAIEEKALYTQMWCCGGVMPFYEYQHIPGIDHLGRKINSGLSAKQVGSVAAQLGKKRVLAEIYACSGYDTTPQELKGITDALFVEGVNFICQHLYPYSSRGERKYDYPTHFSDILPWHDYLKDINEHYNRLGCLLSLGQDTTNILVLHPMHSAYLYYRREEDRKSIEALENSFETCLNQLWSEHLQFHLGDETLIRKYGSVQEKQFVVGKCSYDVVIMPDMDSIDDSTQKLLEKYVHNGGKLFCMGRTPKYLDGKKCELSYASNTDLHSIKAAQGIRIDYHGEQANMLKYAVRVHEGRKIMFLANLTDKPMEKIRIAGLETKEQTISLKPYESRIIINQVPESRECTNVQELGNEYEVKTPVENYLVLDFARVSFDGIHYSEKKPIPLISQELLEKRQEGNVWLQFEYQVSEMPEQLYLIVEPQKYREIRINGKLLQKQEDKWRIDRRFLMYDVRTATRIGINTVEMCFDYRQNEEVYNTYFANGTESLRNCMSFETEIDQIYLMGNFELESVGQNFWQEDNSFCHDGGFMITGQKQKVNADNLTLSGYPFFYGKIELTQKVHVTEDINAVCIEGRYGICEVWVGEKLAGICGMSNVVELTGYIQPGENELRLVVYSSVRNLLGPFHYKVAEPLSVSPRVFTHEKFWKDEVNERFKERYALVAFGIKTYLCKIGG